MKDKKTLISELDKISHSLDKGTLAMLVEHARVLAATDKSDKGNTGVSTTVRTKVVEAPNRGKKKEAPEVSNELKVEESENGSFIFIISGERKFFTLQEMRRLVKICHSASDTKDGALRLYRWFKTNRSDFLFDVEIESGTDIRLINIYTSLVSKYTTKE